MLSIEFIYVYRMVLTINSMFLNSINWRVVVMETVRVSCEVRTEPVCGPREGVAEHSQSRQTVKYGQETHWTRNQESLCWRGPAVI
jgi:hypothetical protein